MSENSRLILSTPNPFGLYNILRILVKKYPEINPEHILFLDPVTLSNLIQPAQLEIEAIYANTDCYQRSDFLNWLFIRLLKWHSYYTDYFVYILKAV